MHYNKLSLLILLLTYTLGSFAQQGRTKDTDRFCLAFYNVENLFDTINQPRVIDEDFTPTGKYTWSTQKYQNKLHNIAQVIGWINGGPDIIGLAEVENKQVLQDLVAHPLIKKQQYAIVHIDSPDPRGIDCALLYKPTRFKVLSQTAKTVRITNEPQIDTRDLLYVKGKADGEILHIIVAHWPSRGGGELETRHRRVDAAQATKAMCDSIMLTDKNAKIIMMGDLNDDPDSPSLSQVMGVQSHLDQIKSKGYFTPMLALHQQNEGTLSFRGKWNLFDIMVLSGSLHPDNTQRGYRLEVQKEQQAAYIFKHDDMQVANGHYKGAPKRTHVGTRYDNGYSDHFPVYLFLVK